MTLRRALAADWARAVMEAKALSPGTARIAVAGAQLTGELVRVVTELSPCATAMYFWTCPTAVKSFAAS